MGSRSYLHIMSHFVLYTVVVNRYRQEEEEGYKTTSMITLSGHNVGCEDLKKHNNNFHVVLCITKTNMKNSV